MRIIACQWDIVWEDREANHRRVRELLTKQMPERGTLVVLPEMFASGFSMDVGKITGMDGHPTGHPTEQFLSELARETGVWIIGGVVNPEPALKMGRNEAIAVDSEGSIVARYTKLHPFSPGGERNHYVSGNHIVTFRWNKLTISPFICYDLRFPEAFRTAVRRGAQLFTVIASWPEARAAHWTALLQARAIENQAFVVGVNRVGSDPNHRYLGRSMIIDPSGKVLADAGDAEGCAVADVDARALMDYRTSLPFLNDMRDDLLA